MFWCESMGLTPKRPAITPEATLLLNASMRLASAMYRQVAPLFALHSISL